MPSRWTDFSTYDLGSFLCLSGSSWQVRERTGYKLTREYSLVKKNMAENEILNVSRIGVRTRHCTCFLFSFNVHLTKISKKGSGDFAAAVGFYSCPSGSSVILNHLPKRATCAAYTLAQRIIVLAQTLVSSTVNREPLGVTRELLATYTIVDFENWIFLVCWGSSTEIFSEELICVKLLERHCLEPRILFDSFAI